MRRAVSDERPDARSLARAPRPAGRRAPGSRRRDHPGDPPPCGAEEKPEAGHRGDEGAGAPAGHEGEPFTEEIVESLASTLRVLADPTRIRLIETLAVGGHATVGSLSSGLPLTRQGVSRQLGILHRAGLVRRRREGMWVRYELADWTGWWVVEQLAGAMSDDSAS